ncbi:MAG TPA: hypothetical protein VMQ73_09880 [Methylomirabilota bacterium]|nr:hypothetical protein [Methylomirabilota bacterium]
MKWILTFSAVCLAAIAVVLVLGWAANGFTTAGLSGHGVVAIVAGVTFTVLLAVGLMALVFYSSRSGQDV